MIDFQNGSIAKLREVSARKFEAQLRGILIGGENIISSFQGIRDYVVFTNKRLITVNVQGFTGKKQDFTSLPYGKIQAFSVETAGVFDLDCELELWFSGLGKVRLEFIGNTDVTEICRMIGEMVL